MNGTTRAPHGPLLSRLLDLEKTPLARPYDERGYDLGGLRRWVDDLGAPDRGLRFLHIAGTKGKGSTAALAESILRTLGETTGLFTSPHLEHMGERIRIGGVALDRAAFDEECARFDAICEQAGVGAPSAEAADYRTVFEYLTAMALVGFRDGACSAVIWETGLGGRLDCTNIVAPKVCAITAIGLDHQRILGGTIGEIAREKAGIMKPGVPVVVQRQRFPEVMPILEAHAREVGCPLVRACEVFEASNPRTGADGVVVDVRCPDGVAHRVALRLHGLHQAANLETALAAAWMFREGRANPEVLLAGAAKATWPGRLEVVRGDAGTLVLDGAHCPLSAQCLGESLAEWESAGEAPARGPYSLVLGMQADKDISGFCRALAESGLIACAHCHEVPGGRGAPAEVVAEAARAAGLPAEGHASGLEALRAAAAETRAVLATGTLYTIAAFRTAWGSGSLQGKP